MDNIFKYQKKDNSSLVVNEVNLDQFVMPGIANKAMPLYNEVLSGYEDPRWVEKSNAIKARDNFTCQLCHVFNPMQDGLIYIQQGQYETYHQYLPLKRSYMIHVKKFDFTVHFDFYPSYHLTMPRLNVHHKIYYRNRNLWDYSDDCLVTLCDDCHHYVHSLNDIGIPIVEENSAGQTILVGKTQPKQYQPRLDHTDLRTFRPFALVKEDRWGIELKGQDKMDFERAMADNKKWYNYHDIFDNHVAHISYFKSYDPRWNSHAPEEIKTVANFIILDFIEKILGFTKINQ